MWFNIVEGNQSAYKDPYIIEFVQEAIAFYAYARKRKGYRV